MTLKTSSTAPGNRRALLHVGSRSSRVAYNRSPLCARPCPAIEDTLRLLASFTVALAALVVVSSCARSDRIDATASDRVWGGAQEPPISSATDFLSRCAKFEPISEEEGLVVPDRIEGEPPRLEPLGIPSEARPLRDALVDLLVETDGLVCDIRIVRGFGTKWDQEIQNVLRKWKFQPPEMNDEPVAAIFRVRVGIKRMYGDQPTDRIP